MKAVNAQKGGDVQAVKTFWTEWLAKPWDDTPVKTTNEDLAKFLAGDYGRGELPEETAFITTTADVGRLGDSGDLIFHWQVMAWWRGAQGAVVDWGLAVGVAEFAAVVKKRYRFQNSATELPVADFPIGLDAAKYSSEVYAVADMFTTAIPIRGDSKTGASVGVDLYYGTVRKADQPASLVAMKRKAGLWDMLMINSERTQLLRHSLVTKGLRPGWAGFVRVPREVEQDVSGFDDWLSQWKADYKKGTVWERNGANEAGDNYWYGRAMAQRYTLNGLRWSTIDLPDRYKPKPPPEVRPPGSHQRRPGRTGFVKQSGGSFISQRN